MQEVRRKLEKEFKDLERELRTELPKEIQFARELGDLRENAEFKAALERQSYVQGRMGQIQQRLSELSCLNVDAIPHDKAHLGSKVTVLDLDSDEEQVYELVVPEAADPGRGQISPASPIGRGLMGKKAGDEVTIKTPSGTRNLEILALRTIHDASDEDDGEAD